MNTEINLIEKQQKKYPFFLLCAIFFLILLMMVVTLLLFQKQHYASKLEVEQNSLAQLEAELLSHQQDMVSEQREKQLLEHIHSVQDKRIPVVRLQEDILSILAPQSKLVSYLFSGGNVLELGVSFPSMEDASQFVTTLNDKPYFVDVHLTYLNKIESSYQANLIVELNIESLIEELGKDD